MARRRKAEKLPAIAGLSREMLDLAAATYGWKDSSFDRRLDCGPEETNAYYARLAREVYHQLTPSEIEALRQDSRDAQASYSWGPKGPALDGWDAERLPDEQLPPRA
jgi:hypothetical protein